MAHLLNSMAACQAGPWFTIIFTQKYQHLNIQFYCSVLITFMFDFKFSNNLESMYISILMNEFF